MTLFLNNHDVEKTLTMADTIAALETSYLQLAAQDAICRPRIDIRIPTSDPNKNYQWGTMEGGSVSGYFAIRMKSDIITWPKTADGGWTEDTGYSNSTRVAPSFGAASSGSKATTATAFNISGSATIAGAFMCTVATGTSGILYSAGNFTGGSRIVASGDTLNVTYTFSLDAA